MAIIQRVTVKQNECGVQLRDGEVERLLPPGRHWVLSWAASRRVDLLDAAASPDVPPELAARLAQARRRPRPAAGLSNVLQVLVPDEAVGLLRIDGTVARRLAPGPHAFWRIHHDVAVDLVDLRLQSLDLPGQDVLTRDHVPLRLDLAATWHVADALCAVAQLHDPAAHLRRELRLGLREAVGTRTLDELLAHSVAVDDEVAGHVRRRLWAHGVLLDTVGVTGLVWPVATVE